MEEKAFKEFEFPTVWKDNSRMKVLFSAFHQRQLSPENYDTKMVFWTDLIKKHCSYFGEANFCLRELQLQFMRGEQIPACLDTVIAHMEQQKQIRLRSEYEYDPLNSWSGWLVNSFVKRPLSRSWRKLKHSIIAEDLSASSLEEWIHLDVLESLCREMDQKVLQQHRGKLLHYEAFKSLCKACQMHIHDKFLPLCLLTLQTRRLVALEQKIERQSQSIHLIKIPGKFAIYKFTRQSKVNEDLIITDADHAVHNLEMTQASLLKQLEELEDSIKANDDKARQYVKENKRQLAKTYLRKRRLLEKNHERRSLALHNIDTLLSNVDEARSSGVVLDAYKIGSKTLQKVLNESGLQYDNVDEVLADVREAMDQHREVQEVMSNTVDVVAQDEDELELELRNLMGEGSTATAAAAAAAAEPMNLFNNNDKPEIVIDDEHLIAMLDDLDVEDGTLSQASHKTLESLSKS
ncbi:hypothetical protein KR222_007773 [Zaprionus bogoriensis]|nr:hypothetical protein KR222_007773 [Zaprionus bogoriensis]